ncbi:MAG: hypothetical protein ACR2GX_08945 [Candidatus Dormibacteria bacterium]
MIALLVAALLIAAFGVMLWRMADAPENKGAAVGNPAEWGQFGFLPDRQHPPLGSPESVEQDKPIPPKRRPPVR